MNFQTFAGNLKRFAFGSETGFARGEKSMAAYLAWWFGTHQNLDDQELVGDELPQLLLYALSDLYRSPEPQVVVYRQEFQDESLVTVPDMTSPQSRFASDQAKVLEIVQALMPRMMYELDIQDKLELLFKAQYRAIDQAFLCFLDRVYRHGMQNLIMRYQGQAMNGSFGICKVRSVPIIGNVVLTFTRRSGGDELGRVQFVVPTGSKLGIGGRLSNCEADLSTVLFWLNEVVTEWPPNYVLQGMEFKAEQPAGVR